MYRATCDTCSRSLSQIGERECVFVSLVNCADDVVSDIRCDDALLCWNQCDEFPRRMSTNYCSRRQATCVGHCPPPVSPTSAPATPHITLTSHKLTAAISNGNRHNFFLLLCQQVSCVFSVCLCPSYFNICCVSIFTAAGHRSISPLHRPLALLSSSQCHWRVSDRSRVMCRSSGNSRWQRHKLSMSAMTLTLSAMRLIVVLRADDRAADAGAVSDGDDGVIECGLTVSTNTERWSTMYNNAHSTQNSIDVSHRDRIIHYHHHQ